MVIRTDLHVIMCLLDIGIDKQWLSDKQIKLY